MTPAPTPAATTTERPTGPVPAETTVTRAQLVSMAEKVGCAGVRYRKTAPGDVRDVGATGGVDCDLRGSKHIFIHMRPHTSPWAVALVVKDGRAETSVPYLRGDNWGLFVFARAGTGSEFDEPALRKAHRRIGEGVLTTA